MRARVGIRAALVADKICRALLVGVALVAIVIPVDVALGQRSAGSAASVVDLNAFLPPGFVYSNASGIDAAGDIVGSASTAGHSDPSHAILWKRNVPKPSTSRQQNTTRC